MRILHILRQIHEDRALAVAERQRASGHQVTLLLLQDAVLSRPRFGDEIYACAEDVKARTGQAPYPTLDYDGIARMIFEYERVVSW